MHAPARIAVDTNRPSAALGRFPPDRAMIIDGREVKGRGKTIERSSPAHGVVTRVPRGTAEDVRAPSRQASGVVTLILRSAFDEARAPARSGLTLHGPSAGAAVWRLSSVGG